MKFEEIEQKKKRPIRRETKTKRLNLLIKPSIYEGIYKIAYVKQDSVNNLISSLLEEYIGNHQEELQAFEELDE